MLLSSSSLLTAVAVAVAVAVADAGGGPPLPIMHAVVESAVIELASENVADAVACSLAALTEVTAVATNLRLRLCCCSTLSTL